MTVWVLLLVSPAPGGESSSDRRRRIFGSTVIPGKAQEEGMGEMSWFPLWCFAWQAHPSHVPRDDNVLQEFSEETKPSSAPCKSQPTPSTA